MIPKRKQMILIVGKTPPPIGGVSIHVRRLTERMTESKHSFSFQELKKPLGISAVLRVTFASRIHLHTSNTYLCFTLALLRFLLGRQTIITFHGDIGRFGRLRSIFENLAIRLATHSILLNESSLRKARLLSKRTSQITSFIAPTKTDPLPSIISECIRSLRDRFRIVFCTNAYGVTFDKYGNEIYGITQLIETFSLTNDYSLIISDPSAAYAKKYKRENYSLPRNVMILDYPHDFINVLLLSDCMIRATTTDGDSLSVRESLFYGKPVIASDCVPRPTGCYLYPSGNSSALLEAITKFTPGAPHTDIKDGFPEIYDLYRKLNRE